MVVKQALWNMLAIAALIAGTSNLAHAQYQEPRYGQPPYGQSSYSRPSYGQSGYAQPGYGTANPQGYTGYPYQQGYGAPTSPNDGGSGQAAGAMAGTGLGGGAGAAVSGALGAVTGRPTQAPFGTAPPAYGGYPPR